jgi:endonuclease YncB( thermonuclease family)
MTDPISLLAIHGTSAPLFTLNGQAMYGRLVSMYDGDTVTLALPIFGTVYKFNMRLSGIDTPEMKSKLPEVRIQAIRARNRLLQLAGLNIGLDDDMKKKDIVAMLESANYLVWVVCGEQEKYGRTLCKLYKDNMAGAGESFAETLIREKYAYAYGGGTKLQEQDQMAALT